jgi:amino acid transporter
MLPRLKKLLLGSPLRTTELPHQRLSKKAALAVFSSDALSSSAYATEEMLLALRVGGAAVLYLSLPAAAGIVVLLAIVVISYSQTIHAYPSGGGAYIVAKDNLGVTPGLVAGASLLIDYVLTVSVSITAGVAAITSALPALFPYRVTLCLAFILIILLANLRGVRESATLFGIPVYWFVFSAYLMVIGGLFRAHGGDAAPAAPPALAATEHLPLMWLFLRAFASGCTALTGVEAISNGVQAFKPPVSRNASITLFWMAAILGTLFLGITLLAHRFGVVPLADETVNSQINRIVFGTGPIYYMIQAATTAILILAANTAFADFPRLSSILAKDRFAPRQLANLGDRLVFSNGVIVLGLAASALIVAFGGDTHRLIPLYMIGVFLSFTLSQYGMVGHWKKSCQPGRRWRMALNAFGGTLTLIVLGVVAAVKFTHGAWLVMVAISLLVVMFRAVRRHYFEVTTELSLADFDKPRVLRHTVIIPVPAAPNRVVLAAVEYAKSISDDVMAVHVSTDGHEREELETRWKRFVDDVPLVVLASPYRTVLRPLLRFIDEMADLRPEDEITVLLPEFVPVRWWHTLLHNQTSLILKGALLFRPGIVVTSVPVHLRRGPRRRASKNGAPLPSG